MHKQYNFSWRIALDVIGLIVIALATGGIKPCVSAFAADQFKVEQNREREQFFRFNRHHVLLVSTVSA